MRARVAAYTLRSKVDGRAPRSQRYAPSFRLRLHVPDLPPSPCSNGRSGTGRIGEKCTHARAVIPAAVRRSGDEDE